MRLLAFALLVGVAALTAKDTCEDDPESASRLTEVSLLQAHHVTQPTHLTLLQDGRGKSHAEVSTAGLGVPVGVTVFAAIMLFVLDKTHGSVQEYSAIFAEFLGTFALVFTVACCVTTGSGVWNATAIACVLMVMVYGTGPVSGGHLNPAVTFALAWCDKFPWEKVPVYCATQIIAGIAAGSCVVNLFGASPSPLAPVGDFAWPHAFFVEAVYTFMLCFVVLNTAASKRNNEEGDGNQFFGLAIGFVIIAGGYAGGDVSGACFNPAVAFGLDFSSINSGMSWSFAWTGFEIFGAGLAALAFRCLRPEDFSTVELATYEPSLPVKLASEFLGTFMLVLTVGLNVVLGSASTAWSAAAALMCMIYALGDVSGAHFNPAVSLAVKLRGKCSWTEFGSYIPVQLLAGASAGAIVSLFHKIGAGKDTAHFLQPGKGHSMLEASIVEMVFTFVLCYVVLATATTAKPESQLTKQNFYFGLAIASCVTAGGFAGGAVSGGELNPAVSTGLSVASSIYSPEGATIHGSTIVNLLQLATFEFLGGLLAVMIFYVTHPTELEKEAAWYSCYAAEFLGTFVLVFTVVCNVLAGDANWSPTSIACSLMVMIYATGGVSGGHLNPAVTFAIALATGDWSLKTAGYWASQLAGGIAAGFAACSLYTDVANVEVKEPYHTSHALMAELIYTAMLAFTVLSVAVSKRNNPANDGNNFYALAIGWVIIAGGYAVGGVSGAAFNPAVAIGLDVSSYSKGVGMGFLWGLFELLGAVVAVALFRVIRVPRQEDYLDAPPRDDYEPPLLVKLLSEFLGVFMLVLTVGLNLANDSPATAWSAAAALMCMIYSLGDVSGAHFNPAVTMAVVASGRKLCSTAEGVAYAATQLLAGTAAGIAYSVYHAAGPKKADFIGLGPAAKSDYTLSQAGVVELSATLLLAYVVLSCATVPPAGGNTKTKNSFYFALAIGSCVTVGGFAIGAVSGGELNPAVCLGITAASGMHRPADVVDNSFSNFIRLGIWEVTGAVAAAAAFKLSHSKVYADLQAEAEGAKH